MELWKMHPVFTDYEVSDLGTVRRRTAKKGTIAGRIKKQFFNKTGYLEVMIGTKKKKVHALVLETFVSERPYKHDACHNDGNRTNNILSNLRWATRKENIADAISHGTFGLARRAYWVDQNNRAKKSEAVKKWNQENPERYAQILEARLEKVQRKQSQETIAKRVEARRIHRQIRLLADALL